MGAPQVSSNNKTAGSLQLMNHQKVMFDPQDTRKRLRMAELSKPLFNPFQALLDYEKNSAKLLGPKIHCPLHTSQLQLRLNSNEERKQQQRQEDFEEEEDHHHHHHRRRRQQQQQQDHHQR